MTAIVTDDLALLGSFGARILITHDHTVGLHKGDHVEKADLHPRKISQLRLHRTTSDRAIRVRFPLALPFFLLIINALQPFSRAACNHMQPSTSAQEIFAAVAKVYQTAAAPTSSFESA